MCFSQRDRQWTPTVVASPVRPAKVLQLMILDVEKRSADVDSSLVSGSRYARAPRTATAWHYHDWSRTGSGTVRCGLTTVTTACQEMRHKTGAQTAVHEAVNREIEAGVQVRQHGRVQVNRQRQTVRVVIQQHDDIRAPAADERYEDDKHRLHLTNCFHRCHVTSFIGYLQIKQKCKCS